MEKGIERAVGDVLPLARHGFCLRHMEKNLVKHFKTNLNGALWKAAMCATKADFDDYIATVRAANPAAADYISAIPAEKWARSHFGAARFGHLTSNMAESTNSWLEDARHLPPTQFFACFVRNVNGLFFRRRKKYAEMPANSFPRRVAAVLATSIDEGRYLRVTRNSEQLFEVQSRSTPNCMRVVNTANISCTCGFPQETKLPCRHLAAALMFDFTDPRTLVAGERRVEALRAVYAGCVVPIDISQLRDDGLRPPAVRRGRGRPRVKRIRSAFEGTTKR